MALNKDALRKDNKRQPAVATSEIVQCRFSALAKASGGRAMELGWRGAATRRQRKSQSHHREEKPKSVFPFIMCRVRGQR